jgi:hypothetical protein
MTFSKLGTDLGMAAVKVLISLEHLCPYTSMAPGSFQSLMRHMHSPIREYYKSHPGLPFLNPQKGGR